MTLTSNNEVSEPTISAMDFSREVFNRCQSKINSDNLASVMLEHIAELCDEYEIELENSAKYITPELKSHLEANARRINLMKVKDKTRRLF